MLFLSLPGFLSLRPSHVLPPSAFPCPLSYPRPRITRPQFCSSLFSSLSLNLCLPHPLSPSSCSLSQSPNLSLVYNSTDQVTGDMRAPTLPGHSVMTFVCAWVWMCIIRLRLKHHDNNPRLNIRLSGAKNSECLYSSFSFLSIICLIRCIVVHCFLLHHSGCTFPVRAR